MKNQRVVWSNGMFLTPQHFQVQDDYFEQALHFRFTASAFANWGFSKLAIDEAGLTNGFFRVRFCAGLLPDGLLFNMPEAEDPPPGRAVEQYFPPSRQRLSVYLAIPEASATGVNYTLQAKGSGDPEIPRTAARFVAETRLVRDATQYSEERPIQVAQKGFRLLLEGESLEGFTAMRIAQIARDSKGAYVLGPKFIPPLLDISASEYLMSLARRQIDLLIGKSESLSLPRREKGRETADYTTRDIADFWLLHTINSCLPDLNHIWKVRRGHPDVLFRSMLHLAGGLSTFSTEFRPQNLPDYDHDNLGVCFTELDGKLRDLLDTVLPSKSITIPFEQLDRLVWSANIPQEQDPNRSKFFISINAQTPSEELIGKFSRLAKVSSPAEIRRLIEKQISGVPLRHVPLPPGAIPVKWGNQYFELEQRDSLWTGIAQSRTVNVSIPGEIREPQMELVIIMG